MERRRARWLGAALLVTPVLRVAVLVHAVPAGRPWRTGCQSCDAPLGPGPPTGRCGGCGQHTGAPAYLLELAMLAGAGLVVVAVAAGGWSPWAAVALAGWTVLAVALVFVDLAVHRLPDRLTLPAAAWVLVWLGLADATGGGGSWVRAAAAGALCGGGFALFALIPRSYGYGFGDAKLALGAGALLGWLGWTVVIAGLFLAFLANGLVAVVLLALRRVRWRDALPFGPFLIGGTLAALAWAGLSA